MIAINEVNEVSGINGIILRVLDIYWGSCIEKISRTFKDNKRKAIKGWMERISI